MVNCSASSPAHGSHRAYCECNHCFSTPHNVRTSLRTPPSFSPFHPPPLHPTPSSLLAQCFHVLQFTRTSIVQLKKWGGGNGCLQSPNACLSVRTSLLVWAKAPRTTASWASYRCTTAANRRRTLAAAPALTSHSSHSCSACISRTFAAHPASITWGQTVGAFSREKRGERRGGGRQLQLWQLCSPGCGS